MGDQKLLSQRFVDTTNEPGKYFDKNGLFLRVKKGGSKKWVFRYSFNGRRPEMGLGNAKVIKLSKAREKALTHHFVVDRAASGKWRFFGTILSAIQRLTILFGKTENKKSLLICIEKITALDNSTAMRL